MNSTSRILTSAKAMVAELPLGHYLLSSIVCIIMLIIHSSEMDSSGLNLPTELNGRFMTLPRIGAYTFILVTSIFSATILGVDFITRELKDENRAARLLALPLSATERATSLGIISWIVFPILCIIPPFLILSLLSLFGGSFFLAPSPEFYLLAIPTAWAGIILLSSLWLFPSVILPRRGAILFILILCAIGLYVIISRNELSDMAFIDYTDSPFTENDVVGMDKYRVLQSDAPPERYAYVLTDHFGMSGILAMASIIALYASALFALTRKTA